MEYLNRLLIETEVIWQNAGTYLVRLFGAFLIFVAGWLCAKIFRKFLLKILQLLRFETLAEKAGFEDFLLQGGVRLTATSLLANICYWIVLFVISFLALSFLGVDIASAILNKLVFYIPKVIVALVILIFGSLLANLGRGMTYTYLSNVGVQGARLISQIAYLAVMIFILSLVLEQLSIGGEIVVSAFQIAFGSLCLSTAIAFGLGGKDWASKVLERVFKK